MEPPGIVETTLTNVIVVLEKVFKNLTARQLNTCARVCRVWRNQAQREKERRHGLTWNCFVYEGDEGEELDEDWWNSVTSYILESRVQPKCLLIFCTDSLLTLLVVPKSQERKKRKKQSAAAKKQKTANEIFASYLPSDCLFHVVVTDGIVGTDAALKTTEIEDHSYHAALSLMMFGDMAGVDFISFSVSHQECIPMAKYWSELNDKILPGVQELTDKEVKMISLFCPMSGIDQELGYSFFRMFKWPLIAGGYVNERWLRDSHGAFHSSEADCMVSGLAICGTDVKVASVLISSEVSSEEEVAAAVCKLKDHDLPLEKSFGLMYACVGRGCHVYDKPNVESGIFRKHFPNTPLLGFFGNGEIGCCYPPVDPLFVSPGSVLSRSSGSTESMSTSSDNDENGCSDSPRLSNAQLKRQIAEMRQKQDAHMMKHPPKLLHAYTTVMCLISLP